MENVQIISRRDVMLCWGLAEALSPRWKYRYAGQLSAAAGDAIAAATLPSELPEVVQDELITMIERRRHAFVAQYVDPSERFLRIRMTAAQLPGLTVSPALSWKKAHVPLSDYLNGEYNPSNWSDPRTAAMRMYKEPSQVAYEGCPIIAYDVTIPAYVLMEGYCRSLCRLLRLRDGQEVAPFDVLVCERAEAPFTLAS